MIKTLLMVISVTFSMSNPFQQIQDELIENQNALMQQLNSDINYYFSETQRNIDKILVRGQNMSAGGNSIGTLDFGDHEGFSVGLSAGTGNTWDSYRAIAGATGVQYRNGDFAYTVKGWLGDEKIYGVGFSVVWEL